MIFLDLVIIALSFVLGNYYPTMDYLGLKKFVSQITCAISNFLIYI